jgi:hypothetical protein
MRSCVIGPAASGVHTHKGQLRMPRSSHRISPTILSIFSFFLLLPILVFTRESSPTRQKNRRLYRPHAAARREKVTGCCCCCCCWPTFDQTHKLFEFGPGVVGRGGFVSKCSDRFHSNWFRNSSIHKSNRQDRSKGCPKYRQNNKWNKLNFTM